MISLRFKKFGEGVPVIILHGLFGSLDNWQTFARSVAKNYQVYTVDQRNHGRSPHTHEFNYTILATDLADFMDEEGIYQAHLIGHSMGGKTVMQFADIYPDYALSLTMIDIGPKQYEKRHVHIFRALMQVPVQELSHRREARAVLMEALNNKPVVNFLLKNLHRRKTGGFEWKMHLKSLYRNYEEVIAAVYPDTPVEIPALFIRGEQSDYILDADIDAIREDYHVMQLVTIPGAGHWVHVDQPALLEDTVISYLKGVESGEPFAAL